MSLKMLVQIAINTLGAGYAASMYNTSPVSHAAAGAVGSFLTELIGSVFYFGFNDWKSFAVNSMSAPLVSGLAIAINDQVGFTTTYIAIGAAQVLYALVAFYNPWGLFG